MKYEQRAPVDRESFRRTAALWVPAAKDAADARIELAPAPDDHYVVVDEIVGGRVGLVDSPWPSVDAGGRLHFAGSGEQVPKAFTVEELQRTIDKHRAERNQTQRPLRIGDVYLVRGRISSIRSWSQVVDVTAPARLLAKAALFRAISPPRERGAPATRTLGMRATETVGAAPGHDAAPRAKAPRAKVPARGKKSRTLAERRTKPPAKPNQVANPAL